MDVFKVPDFKSLTMEELCMRVPHKCLPGCQELPTDHWPRAEFFEENPEELKQLRKKITLFQHRTDPEFLSKIIEEFLDGQTTGTFIITLEKSTSADHV